MKIVFEIKRVYSKSVWKYMQTYAKIPNKHIALIICIRITEG